jgi:hypothetical protein
VEGPHTATAVKPAMQVMAARLVNLIAGLGFLAANNPPDDSVSRRSGFLDNGSKREPVTVKFY